jgi:hypothetical protein
MSKLRIYSAAIERDYKNMVATTSKAVAAKLMNTTIYRLNKRAIPVDVKSGAGKLALSKPNTLFKQQRFTDKWFCVDRAI